MQDSPNGEWMQPYTREEIKALRSTELGEVSGRLLAAAIEEIAPGEKFEAESEQKGADLMAAESIIEDSAATIELQHKRIGKLLAGLQEMKSYAAGWNAKGPTGPRKPLGWESVGRIVLHRADDLLKEAGSWK